MVAQANEMVADERREGARLRERIRFLEERDAKFAHCSIEAGVELDDSLGPEPRDQLFTRH